MILVYMNQIWFFAYMVNHNIMLWNPKYPKVIYALFFTNIFQIMGNPERVFLILDLQIMLPNGCMHTAISLHACVRLPGWDWGWGWACPQNFLSGPGLHIPYGDFIVPLGSGDQPGLLLGVHDQSSDSGSYQSHDQSHDHTIHTLIAL